MAFCHHDVPGIIGNVGTIFGRYQVNIAQMSVGRATKEPGSNAIGVLNLDAHPGPEAIAEVSALPDILQTRVIELPAAGVYPDWLT